MASLTREELRCATISDPLIVYLPLPSIGYTNMHIDICSDLIDASWVAETLAGYAETAEAENEYLRETHTKRIKLTLHGIKSGILDVLADGISGRASHGATP
ncbi:MAG: hypothetical protein L0H15_00480 [Nitrosospira sp.]|nr:hypothetical protein [Nitrosospira sp.]